jgi:hypothetical protein
MLTSWVYENPNPRFSCNINFVFEEFGPAEQIRLRMEAGAHDPQIAEALASGARRTEFFEWVDSLVQ